MGHHINKDGDFQSDKHPELPVNKIALDFRDKFARPCLMFFALTADDKELCLDILEALQNTKHLIKY